MGNTLLKLEQKEAIEEKVSALLIEQTDFNQWKLVQQTAEKEGIKIEQADLKDLSGILFKDEDNSWKILVNQGDSLTRKLFTVAHELGHYFLHRTEHSKFIDGAFSQTCFNRSEGNKYHIHELEANEFAAILIMPKTVLDKEILALKQKLGTEAIDSDFVNFLANTFGVSPLAMLTRLKNLEYVS